jgi:phage tail-like protein
MSRADRSTGWIAQVDVAISEQFTEGGTRIVPGTGRICDEFEVVEYREGGDHPSGTRKLPGRVSVGNVVLRRGIDRDLSLWNWFRAVRDGDLDRRNVTIVLLDAARADVRRWNVERAWPAVYESGPLHARGNEVVIETLELACERIDIEI